MAQLSPPENDPHYVNTHHNLRRERVLKAGLKLMTLFGTCVTAYATYEAAVIGANSQKAGTPSSSVGANIYIGTQIVGQTITQGQLKVTPAATSHDAPPTQQQPTQPIIQPQQSVKLSRSAEPSCSGLNPKTWDISLGPVHKLILQDGFGYSVLLHLQNKSDLNHLIGIQGTASLTDDLGNTASVSSPTVPPKTFGFTGIKVNSGADASIELRSEKVPELGHGIASLSVPLSIMSSDAQGKGTDNSTYGLTCTNLPLDSVASISAAE